AVTAIVWAFNIASPRRINTNEGGTTTPSVLATVMTAARRGSEMPEAASRGSATRDKASTLAPTEPFIGPSKAPSAKPETTGAAGPGTTARQQRYSASAIGSRLISVPINT